MPRRYDVQVCFVSLNPKLRHQLTFNVISGPVQEQGIMGTVVQNPAGFWVSKTHNQVLWLEDL